MGHGGPGPGPLARAIHGVLGHGFKETGEYARVREMHGEDDHRMIAQSLGGRAGVAAACGSLGCSYDVAAPEAAALGNKAMIYASVVTSPFLRARRDDPGEEPSPFPRGPHQRRAWLAISSWPASTAHRRGAPCASAPS